MDSEMQRKELFIRMKDEMENKNAINEFYDIFEGKKSITALIDNKFNKWLLEYISKLKENSKATNKITIYRSRIIREEDIGNQSNGIKQETYSGYDYENSKEPPFGCSSNGRCNSANISYFYAADTEYTSLVEVKANILDFISLAKFKVVKPIMLADLTLIKGQEHYVFEKALVDIFRFIATDTKDYKISQYVADLFRKYGFDGIKYGSSLSSGHNYTIFNCTNENIQFCESRIVQLCQATYDFADLKQKKRIKRVLKSGLTEKSYEEAEKLQKHIIKLYKQGRN